MKIRSKVLSQLTWLENGNSTMAVIIPGSHNYNTINAFDPMVRMQLYALLDAQLLDFDPKLGRPTEDELRNYYTPKKVETLEVENVRGLETDALGVGGDDDPDSGRGGIPDETENESSGGGEVSERRDEEQGREPKDTTRKVRRTRKKSS